MPTLHIPHIQYTNSPVYEARRCGTLATVLLSYSSLNNFFDTFDTLDRPVQITIFHTNDMHGHLEAMSRLSAFARRLRAEAEAQGRIVFFWDAGDSADRRVPICSATKGAAFAPIVSAMGYTLQTMGNDISLPYGPQAMTAVAARSNFPILAANCRDGEGPLVAGLHEYALVPLPSGANMGAIGLTAPWGDIYQLFGLHFPDFFDLARRLIDQLRAQDAAPIILLSHLGLEDDRRMADALPDLDLIIGAHSHNRLPTGEERNGVLIAQTGHYAEALGRIDLTVDDTTRKVINRSAVVIGVPADEAPDPVVEVAIRAAEREVEAVLARPIGSLQSALDLEHFNECGIGNLAADALREHMGADAAIVASGLFHAGLPAGEISVGQLTTACFAAANPCMTVVSGAQLLTTLENGLMPEITQASPPSLRGTPFGIPQISGLAVQLDPNAESGPRIMAVYVRGEPLDPARTYRLAHTDAEIIEGNGPGYLRLNTDQKPDTEVPTILPEVIEAYIARHSPVLAPEAGRWQKVDSA